MRSPFWDSVVLQSVVPVVESASLVLINEEKLTLQKHQELPGKWNSKSKSPPTSGLLRLGRPKEAKRLTVCVMGCADTVSGGSVASNILKVSLRNPSEVPVVLELTN